MMTMKMPTGKKWEHANKAGPLGQHKQNWGRGAIGKFFSFFLFIFLSFLLTKLIYNNNRDYDDNYSRITTATTTEEGGKKKKNTEGWRALKK
jgi:hypothetical protein